MIPIRDTVRARRPAWFVRLIVLANLAGFVVELWQGPRIEWWLARYGVVPAAWHVRTLADVWRLPQLSLTLVTSQFLHGSPLHLGANMLYLWIFGDNVEDRLGHARFLWLYLGSGVLAGLIQLLMQPHSAVPMIGASGAIAGVLGAYLLFFPSARIVALVPWFVLEFVELPAFLFLGVWFLLQWLQGMTTIGQVADLGGVAWWAHVGGFVSGLAFGLALRPRRRYF